MLGAVLHSRQRNRTPQADLAVEDELGLPACFFAPFAAKRLFLYLQLFWLLGSPFRLVDFLAPRSSVPSADVLSVLCG